MRVIAGVAKGRRLKSPAGLDTRPLTGRAKEALFSSLANVTADARVLDLYAGTGSIGLEALSRGAASCVFVERDRTSMQALQANVEAVGLGGEAVLRDVDRFLGADEKSYDLVFVDPPYALALASVEAVLDRLVPRLATGAIVVLHRRARGETPRVPAMLALTDRRRYGDSELWRYERLNETQEET
jgi:16S rRNA (guanine966-N2)-methyltransferase